MRPFEKSAFMGLCWEWEWVRRFRYLRNTKFLPPLLPRRGRSACVRNFPVEVEEPGFDDGGNRAWVNFAEGMIFAHITR